MLSRGRCPTFPLSSNPKPRDDADDIERLNERVFGPGRFARTAYRIRERADPDPSLSFVARVGTLLVGANSMTPIAIGGMPALLLGPLIVEPVFRSQGIGEALVKQIARDGQGGRLEARDPRRRRALLRAHGISAGSAWPHRPAGPCRSRAPALLRARARSARRSAGRGARRLSQGEKFLAELSQKVRLRRHFAALSSDGKRGFLNTIRELTREPPRIRGDRVGDRRASAAGPPDRVADGRAGGRHLRVVVSDDFLLAGNAVAGADAGRRLDHRLADESAARDHPWPSDAEPGGQRRHRDMAPVAVAALLALSHDPSASPSGRQSDRPFRGSGELLLDDGGMARPRAVRPRRGAGPVDAAGADRPRPRLDDRTRS